MAIELNTAAAPGLTVMEAGRVVKTGAATVGAFTVSSAELLVAGPEEFVATTE